MTRRRILAALLVAGGLAAWGLLRPSALDRARAELDRTDSGWRLDAIWAARTADRPPEPHALAAALKALPLPAEFTAWRKATFDDPARATDRRSPGERWPADP